MTPASTAPAAADCPFCQRLAGLRELPDEDLVGQLAHSVVLLGPWQFYHGYCLVVSRRHATELDRLAPSERRGYLDDMCLVARAIEECFRPDKLNYELLGNQVPHLHWHLFPRLRSDPEALKPVWLALDRAERDPAERRRLEPGPLSRAQTTALLRRKLQELTAGAP
jgi:diadenosine tetraphosphate (Ap4A) HIT family hydrolase